jgi:hypothetical protein
MSEVNTIEVISCVPYKVRIFLSGTPKGTNKILGHSYWVKHKSACKWKSHLAAVIGFNKPARPIEKVNITAIRHAFRMLDFDSCVASLKPVVDGLVECGLLKNDNYSRTGDWSVTQVFRPKKLGNMIELIIEERFDILPSIKEWDSP